MASLNKVRGRNWCFTSFQEAGNQSLDANTGDNSDVIFWCYGNETCPNTGRHHRQGYMQFAKVVSRPWLKRTFDTSIHWEAMRGKQAQAIAYCQKDGDYYAFGEAKQQGKRSDLHTIQEEIDAGATVSQIASDHFAKFCQYGKAFERYRQLKQPDRSWKTEVHVIWGPTGTGKTRECIEKGAVMIDFDKSGFVHGYTNQEVVLLDDFDPACLSRTAFLKLMDRYPMTVNIKGGSSTWNPRIVYLTTNFNPRDWYGGCPAIARRITSITHKDTPFALGSAGGMSSSAEPSASATGGSNVRSPNSSSPASATLTAEIDIAHLESCIRDAKQQVANHTATLARGRMAEPGDIVTL